MSSSMAMPSDQERLRERREQLSLLQVSQWVASIRDLQALLDHIMSQGMEVVGAERGYLFLYEGDPPVLRVKVARHVETVHVPESEWVYSQHIVDRVAQEWQPLRITNAETDPQFSLARSVQIHHLRSVLCVPLMREERMIGLLYLDNSMVRNLFDENDQRLLEIFASQASLAIANAWAYSELRALNESLEEKVRERTLAIEKSYQEVDRAKELFIGKASKDLKVPLLAIQEKLEILRASSAGFIPRQKEYVGIVTRNCEKLIHMVEELLESAQIGSASFKLERVPLAIGRAVQEACSTFRAELESRGIALRQECPQALSPVWADEHRVVQILTNLLDNAMKVTPPGGSIVVQAIPQGQDVEIHVRDSGPGIPHNEVHRIFEPFEQLTKHPVAPRHGVGLGLSIVSDLVKAHGGRVWVESAVGEGSSFSFTLPVFTAG